MNMQQPRYRLAGALALALALIVPAAFAEEPQQAPPKKDAKPKTAAASKPVAKPAPVAPAADSATITNEDLERMFGPPDPAPAPPVEAQPGAASTKESEAYDPLKIMNEQDKKAAEKQTRIAAAEKAVTDAEANLKNLESRMLANKNPYLPRPTLTPEEQKAQEGLDNAQRVEANQKQIEEARAQIEKAKADLLAARSAQ